MHLASVQPMWDVVVTGYQIAIGKTKFKSTLGHEWWLDDLGPVLLTQPNQQFIGLLQG